MFTSPKKKKVVTISNLCDSVLKAIKEFVTDRHSRHDHPNHTSLPQHCTEDLPLHGLGSLKDTEHVDLGPQRNASTS